MQRMSMFPGKSMVHQFQLTKGRKTFVMQCGFHAYMESWGIAVDNPYFTFTTETGSYEITGIPPGTYRLRAWHPSVKQEHNANGHRGVIANHSCGFCPGFSSQTMDSPYPSNATSIHFRGTRTSDQNPATG